MWNKKRIQGLMAQSLYEELGERDAADLARGLEQSPELRREYDELRAFKESVPADSPELNLDLAPLIRARLKDNEAPESVPRYGWRMAAFSAACAVLVAAFGYTTYQSTLPASAPEVQVADAVSPLERSIDEAKRLIQDGQAAAAYDQLARAVANHPEEPMAAQAERMMGDIAYDELQRYAEAQEAYRTYRDTYRTAYMMDPNSQRVSRRLDLLAESESKDFEPLYAIHRARERGESALSELEQVVARNPSQYVAEEAMLEMARIVASDDIGSKDGLLEGLKSAKARCTHPLAQDQFDYAIGRHLHEEFDDSAAALTHLEQAADSDDMRVAAAAKDYLRRMVNRP